MREVIAAEVRHLVVQVLEDPHLRADARRPSDGPRRHDSLHFDEREPMSDGVTRSSRSSNWSGRRRRKGYRLLLDGGKLVPAKRRRSQVAGLMRRVDLSNVEAHWARRVPGQARKIANSQGEAKGKVMRVAGQERRVIVGP